MARYTVSPQGIGRLMEAFAAGPQTRANAELTALQANEIRRKAAQDDERFAAQRQAGLNNIAAQFGLDSAQTSDTMDYLRGVREVPTGQMGEDGRVVMRPLSLPLQFNDPAVRQQLLNYNQTYGDAFAYSPGGAGQLRQTLGLGQQQAAAQEAAIVQNKLAQELAAARNAGDVQRVNLINAERTGKFYEPYGVSGGVVYNRGTGGQALTPIGEAMVGSENAQAYRDTVHGDLYGLQGNKVLAEIEKLQSGGAGGDYFFRDPSGNVAMGPTAHLPDAQIKAMYATADEFGKYTPDYAAYQKDYAEAVRNGFKDMPPYLAAKQAQADRNTQLAEYFDRSMGYPVGGDANSAENQAAIDQYYRNVDKQIEEWAGGAESVAQSKLPNGFAGLNKQQQVQMLLGLKQAGKLSVEEARILFRAYNLSD